jgi:vacuolar protein sorting-associated protein 13A/C
MIIANEQPQSSTSSTKMLYSSDNNEAQVWPRLDGKLTVGQVRLELFVGDGSTFASLEESSLSYFSLNNIELKFCLNTEDALEAELQLVSFIVADSRVRCNNQFRQIVPAIETGDPQFIVHLSRLPSGDMIANATIDSPKVILVLDYLFALRDFALSGLSALQETNQNDRNNPSNRLIESNSTTTSTSADTAATSSDNQLDFRVNVVDAEIILLADPENTASEAIVLSASQLTLARQNVLTLGIESIGMVLCRMDDRSSTSLRLVDEFNMLFSLDTQRASTGEDSTIVDITVYPLIIRASYRDIKMIMGVANKAGELAAKAAVPFEPPELLTTSSVVTSDEEMQRSTSEGQKMVKSNSSSAITSKTDPPTKATTVDSKRRVHVLTREQVNNYKNNRIHINIMSYSYP